MKRKVITYKQICPYCGNTGISGWKHSDGFGFSANSVTCSKCGKEYTISQVVSGDIAKIEEKINYSKWIEESDKMMLDFITNLSEKDMKKYFPNSTKEEIIKSLSSKDNRIEKVEVFEEEEDNKKS